MFFYQDGSACSIAFAYVPVSNAADVLINPAGVTILLGGGLKVKRDSPAFGMSAHEH